VEKPASKDGAKDSLKSKFEAVAAGLPETPNIKIGNLIQAVDNLMKETYKDPLTTDTSEEKTRCMEEKNFYTRLQSVLRETL
jgi:hypothetical protein